MKTETLIFSYQHHLLCLIVDTIHFCRFHFVSKVHNGILFQLSLHSWEQLSNRHPQWSKDNEQLSKLFDSMTFFKQAWIKLYSSSSYNKGRGIFAILRYFFFTTSFLIDFSRVFSSRQFVFVLIFFFFNPKFHARHLFSSNSNAHFQSKC